jgi:CRISPR/Cas system CSM-associated protein Csm3 (group 7 of RAMP superfamily)
VAEGTLIVTNKKQLRIKFTNRNGKQVEMAVPHAELSRTLRQEPIEKLDGRPVEFDEVQGQPKKVRPVGQPFLVPSQPVAFSQQPQGSPHRGHWGQGKPQRGGSAGGHQRQPQQQVQGGRDMEPAFHNPYNFVPAPPRTTAHPDLGDRKPVGHHVLYPDLYTGVIRVRMTAKTPLLIPDAANVVDCPNDHKSFPLRIDADGKPYIPPTSIKGMLRSAYEAVTNSRLSVFVGHEDRLTYRVWDRETRKAPKRYYDVSPYDLLSTSLRPATSVEQLSPADRVFGWVNQKGKGAYKGQLRIGPVICKTPKEQALETFGTPGMPLAILGQPKPQQVRFYVAASPNGEAQKDGLSKEQAGYAKGKGLRGRKVYPHHASLPKGHWDGPCKDRTQQAVQGHFQEYRRPQLDGKEQRDNQNRSIQGWVNPGTEFAFDIHITNLSKVELGALLWSLSLPENHFHRFGGGKPLGFGSVRLEIDLEHTHLFDGNGWRQIYGSLEDSTATEANRDELVQPIQAFQQAVQSGYGSSMSFEQVPFIAAWIRMARGFVDKLPIHYPRARHRGQSSLVPPHRKGLSYEWFVANDRTDRVGGPQASLPDLASDRGLPMLNAR